MDDYKFISKSGYCGIYQIIITTILFLLNLGIYIPNYYIAFTEAKPYVYINSLNTSALITDELCYENENFTIDITKSNNNFLVKNDSKVLHTKDSFYCNNFSQLLMFGLIVTTNYIFQLSSLFFSSRISFSILVSSYYLGLLIISIIDQSTISLINLMTIFSLISPYILSYSINYLTNITISQNRNFFLNLISNISSNSAFLFLLIIKDLTMTDFKITQFILYLSLFLISFLFLFISVDYPKYLAENRGLLISSLTKILKLNYCFNKDKAYRKVKELQELVINNDMLREEDNKRVGKMILVFLPTNFVVGFLFFSSILSVSEYFYDLSINVILFIMCNIVVSIIISFFRRCCPSLVKNILILSYVFTNFINLNNERNLYLFLLRKFTIDNLFSINITQNQNYFSYLNNNKFITVNTILFLSFWQGAILAPFSHIYFDKKLNFYIFQISGLLLLVLNYFIKEKDKCNE
jgi:hypothetical protein